tara:strand:+ start:306 stop:536 length:231 start_codon:yes stop_codon:yes gene_type:complete
VERVRVRERKLSLSLEQSRQQRNENTTRTPTINNLNMNVVRRKVEMRWVVEEVKPEDVKVYRRVEMVITEVEWWNM